MRDEGHDVGDGQTVMLVDDDREMRESLTWLLKMAGFHVEAYSTPGELLAHYDAKIPGCLVIDLQLPGMSGVELLRTLSDRGCQHPFIIISGHGDVSTAVQTMHDGAVDFIEKPFDRKKLIHRIEQAIKIDAHNRQRKMRQAEIQGQIDSLTPREREVMELVADGKLTKQIARHLGISERTVEVHRSHVTKKMNVKSVAQLVRKLHEVP